MLVFVKLTIIMQKYAKLEHVASGESPFNTLAQLGTNVSDSDFPISLSPVTERTQTRVLEKRANSKYFTHFLTKGLLKASGGRGAMAGAYRRTLVCSSDIVVSEDGKAVAHYCKNRWCVVCNRIRTAVTLKKYAPVLATWDDAYFVTLTVRNVTGNELPGSIKNMVETFQLIGGRLKKRASRGRGEKFIGLRKLEVTANAERDDFHPHFHVIVRGRTSAHALRRAWLNAFSGAALPVAQDVRKADVSSSQELFKYASKLVCKVEGRGGRGVYADMQHVIFESIRGVRVLQNFGFKLPPVTDSELQDAGDTQLQGAGAAGAALFNYEQDNGNWVNYETGELLLPKYSVPRGIAELASNIVARPGYKRNGNRAHAVKRE